MPWDYKRAKRMVHPVVVSHTSQDNCFSPLVICKTLINSKNKRVKIIFFPTKNDITTLLLCNLFGSKGDVDCKFVHPPSAPIVMSNTVFYNWFFPRKTTSFLSNLSGSKGDVDCKFVLFSGF